MVHSGSVVPRPRGEPRLRARRAHDRSGGTVADRVPRNTTETRSARRRACRPSPPSRSCRAGTGRSARAPAETRPDSRTVQEHRYAQRRTWHTTLGHHQPITSSDEVTLHADEQVLDGVLPLGSRCATGGAHSVSAARAKVRFQGRPVTRQENRRRLQWVGVGSSICALERPLQRTNLTFTWKGPLTQQQPMPVRAPPTPAGPLGGGPRSESLAGSNRKWWRVWIGIAGTFGPEYALGSQAYKLARCSLCVNLGGNSQQLLSVTGMNWCRGRS